MLETCIKQEELNKSINLRSAFCWLTLHNCIKMHGTKNIIKHKLLQSSYRISTQCDEGWWVTCVSPFVAQYTPGFTIHQHAPKF